MDVQIKQELKGITLVIALFATLITIYFLYVV